MANAITVPDTLEVLLGEILDLTVDFTNLIAPGDAITSPVTTMTGLRNNETIPSALGVPVIVTGNIVRVRLTTGQLRAQTNYALVFSVIATGGATQKVAGAQLTVEVVQ